MITPFKNIYIIHTLNAKKINDPVVKDYKNTRQWAEGWIQYPTHTLTFRTKLQHDLVTSYYNLLGISSDNERVEFHEEYNVDSQLVSDYRYFHPAVITDRFHSLINLSMRYEGNLTDFIIWQFYLADNAVEYGVKFNRPITSADKEIMNNISTDLSNAKI